MIVFQHHAGLCFAFARRSGPFYQYFLTLILAGISNHMPIKVWHYLQILKLERLHRWSVGMDG